MDLQNSATFLFFFSYWNIAISIGKNGSELRYALIFLTIADNHLWSTSRKRITEGFVKVGLVDSHPQTKSSSRYFEKKKKFNPCGCP